MSPAEARAPMQPARSLPRSAAAPLHGSRAAERDVVFRLSRGLFYLAVFFVPLPAVGGAFGFAISDVLLFTSLGLSFLSLVRRRAMAPAWLWAASALAFCATMLIAVDSSDPSTDLAVGLRMLFVWGVWGTVAVRVLLTRQHLVRAATAYVVGGVVTSAVAMGQFLGYDARPFFATEALESTARFVGLNGHPNGQGGTLAIAVVLCAAAVLYRVRPLAAAAAGATTLIGLLLCASITGLLAAALGGLALLIRANRFRVALGATAALGVVVVGYALLKEAFPGLVTPFDRLDSALGITGISTVDSRWATVEFAWRQISADPILGAGFVSAASVDGRTATHNMLLLAWYQGGLLFALGVLLVLAGALRMAWTRAGDGAKEAFACAALSAVFFAMTGPSLYDRYVWFPVIMLAAWHHIARAAALPSGARPV